MTGAPAAGPEAHAALGRALARNTVWTVGARLGFLVAWALVTPALLDRLGPERFAIWALFFTLSGWFALFDLGLSSALVRFVAAYGAAGDRTALRGLVTLGTLLYGGLGAVGIAALARFHGAMLDLVRAPAALRGEAGPALVAMGAVLAVQNLAGVALAVLSGRQRMDLSNRALLAGTGVQIAGVLVVLAAGGGLGALVGAMGAGALVTAAAGLVAVRAVAPEVRLDPAAMRAAGFGGVARYSAALQVVNLGFLAQFQLDKLLLAHLVTLAAVTPFELGYRLTSAAWAAPMLLVPPLIPAFADLQARGDRDGLSRLYRRASRYLYAAAFPVAAASAVAAPALVGVWLGPGHAEVARAVRWMTAFLLASALTGACTAYLRGAGRPGIEAEYHGLGFALHLGLSLWLVPRLGLEGALIAMLCSGVAGALWLLARFHAVSGEPVGRWFVETLPGPLAVSAVAGAVAWLAGGAVAAHGAAGWAVLLRAAAAFAVVVPAGYALARVVTPGEVLGLLRAAPDPAGNAPR